MKVDPTLDEIVNGERGILRGVEVCLKHECLVSGVSLIFSAIDALSALTWPKSQPDTDREVFKKWVTKYLQPESYLNCNADDLYAARCGVLHTYTADSRESRNHKARPIVYQWQDGPRADASTPLPKDTLIVRVEALHNSFKTAISKFLTDCELEPPVRDCVKHHLPSLLCYAPWPRHSVQVAA